MISLRYGIDDEEPETIREVARRFGLKEPRVREIEAKPSTALPCAARSRRCARQA